MPSLRTPARSLPAADPQGARAAPARKSAPHVQRGDRADFGAADEVHHRLRIHCLNDGPGLGINADHDVAGEERADLRRSYVASTVLPNA